MGGREPQIHKLWSFAEEGVTREVHPFARIGVGDFIGDCFQTAYATEIGRRVFIYGRKSINGSVEWIVVPDLSCNTGVAWTKNILVPNLCWGDRRSCKRWASATHCRPHFGGRSVPWHGVVPFRSNYVPSSPENARARIRRVLDNHLRENRLERAQTLLRNLHFGGERGNGSNDSLDGWVDEFFCV